MTNEIDTQSFHDAAILEDRDLSKRPVDVHSDNPHGSSPVHGRSRRAYTTSTDPNASCWRRPDQTSLGSSVDAGKAFTADQAFADAAQHDRLEHAVKEFTVMKAAMGILRKGRLIRISTVEIPPTEAWKRQVHVNMIA